MLRKIIEFDDEEKRKDLKMRYSPPQPTVIPHQQANAEKPRPVSEPLVSTVPEHSQTFEEEKQEAPKTMITSERVSRLPSKEPTAPQGVAPPEGERPVKRKRKSVFGRFVSVFRRRSTRSHSAAA